MTLNHVIRVRISMNPQNSINMSTDAKITSPTPIDIYGALKAYYDKVNPGKLDYNHSENADVNELRSLRDAFTQEAAKYQKMIDRKILELNDVTKFDKQYIIYVPNGYEIVLMHVETLERQFHQVRFAGYGMKIYPDKSIYVGKIEKFILYNDINLVEIMTKEKYVNEFTRGINSALSICKTD